MVNPQNRFDVYPHPHLICIRCHKIVDADVPPPSDLAQQVAGQAGFRLIGQRIEFYGLCPACQSAEPGS